MTKSQQSTGNMLFAGGHYRMAMGLSPLREDEWLAPGARLREILAAKQDLLANRHDEVFRALPEAEASGFELLQLLAAHLPRRYPTCYRRDDNRLVNRASEETWDIAAPQLHPIDLAGRLVEEDICLMQAGDGGYRLTAASLCSPNRWRLDDKLGQPPAAIHTPVPGFEAALERPVTHFFAALKEGRILGRVNWGIADDPAHFQPEAGAVDRGIDAERAGEQLWLRVERQSLCRLAQTGAVLFTIRTEITRLDDAIRTKADAADLAAAIRDMSPAMQRYKHLATVAPALLAWLDARGHSPEFGGGQALAACHGALAEAKSGSLSRRDGDIGHGELAEAPAFPLD